MEISRISWKGMLPSYTWVVQGAKALIMSCPTKSIGFSGILNPMTGFTFYIGKHNI